MTFPEHVFIFDVESVGLHGEGFAVAGGVYRAENAAAQSEFRFCCPTLRLELTGPNHHQ